MDCDDGAIDSVEHFIDRGVLVLSRKKDKDPADGYKHGQSPVFGLRQAARPCDCITTQILLRGAWG